MNNYNLTLYLAWIKIRFSTLCVALCLLSYGVDTLKAETESNVNVIIQRAAERDRVLQARRKGYNYDLTITVEKLDDHGRSTSNKTDKKVVFGDKRPAYTDSAAEGTASQGLSKQADKVSQKEAFNIMNCLSHYSYKMRGIEVVNGASCYRVHFTPKKGMPYSSREEKVANQIEGDICVTCNDYSLVRNEGALSQPVSVAWFFATLREMKYRFDALALPNGDFVPSKLVYEFKVATPVGPIRQRHTTLTTNYRVAGRSSVK